jgi:FkbM family methyltransferase
MKGATGNLYVGLQEFQDMAFLMHFLRPDDLFIDIGANVGSYTILAAAVSGSSVVAFEPIPTTYVRLLENIQVNTGLRVIALNEGLGAESGHLLFSVNLDAENHVLPPDVIVEGESISVKVNTLDDAVRDLNPIMIKIDVEGFETEVIRGGLETFISPSLLAVLIELNGSGSRYGFSEDDIRVGFAHRGFSPYWYDPFSRRLNSANSNEVNEYGNILYIKDFDTAQNRLNAALPFEILGQKI